jgi:hypothetical protein
MPMILLLRSLGEVGMRAYGVISGIVALLLGSAAAAAPSQPAYPQAAPLAQYRSANAAEEIALARSAAPASISGKAEILVMGPAGYASAVKGSNGFVCLVERSWGTDLDDPEFWNPKVRSPQCLNAAAARSVLPAYLERTRWVLAGLTRAQIAPRAKATATRLGPPAPGAMCFMMSKQGYLADAVGHAHPHLMFFLPRTPGGAWGAGQPGAPVAAAQGTIEPMTTFFVTVPRWSDGTSAVDMH